MLCMIHSWRKQLCVIVQDTDFQFGIKQYLIAAGAMVLIINLNAHYSDLQGYAIISQLCSRCVPAAVLSPPGAKYAQQAKLHHRNAS